MAVGACHSTGNAGTGGTVGSAGSGGTAGGPSSGGTAAGPSSGGTAGGPSSGGTVAGPSSGGTVAGAGSGDEEFNGPFVTWTNVKTACGARGDGVTDDTVAIQHCMNGVTPAAPTIYFPAGKYLISSTLHWKSQIHVRLIGQDPRTTSLVWAGPQGGTLLYFDGVAYSQFDRLTLEGRNAASILVDQSWDGTSHYFDGSNEYADDFFQNATSFGLHCGFAGGGCADVSILRDEFIHDGTGIALGNYNAIGVYVWSSLFKDNAIAIDNSHQGGGNIEVYYSEFLNSSDVDVKATPGQYTLRDNYSNSPYFAAKGGGNCNPQPMTIQGNTLVNLASGGIATNDFGAVVLLDNKVIAAPGAVGPVVSEDFKTCGGSDLFSMGNEFTIPNATAASGHYHSVDDQVVAASAIDATPPPLPSPPPQVLRPTFEVTPGMTAAQIQAVIDQAAAVAINGQRPIVHIQPASKPYSIDATLVVPAANGMSAVQVIGDGFDSHLLASGASPVLRLAGPSKSLLRDFSVSGSGHSDDIEIDGIDQAGAHVFLEQAHLEGSQTDLFVDGLDRTRVEAHELFNGGALNYGPSRGTSIVVTGGPSASAGTWLGGTTELYNGDHAGSYLEYATSNGAHLSIHGAWNDCDGTAGNQIATVTGGGAFTYAGSELYLCQNGLPPEVAFHNFHGQAALIGLALSMNHGGVNYGSGSIAVAGNGTGAQILGVGLHLPTTSSWADTTGPVDTTELLNSFLVTPKTGGVHVSELPEIGSAAPAFLAATLDQMRSEQPSKSPSTLPANVSDVRMYRIFADTGLVGLHLKP